MRLSLAHIVIALAILLGLVHFGGLALGVGSPLIAAVDWGRQIALPDLAPGALLRVSEGPDGAPPNSGSYSSEVSDDGRWVVFVSLATNLLDPPQPLDAMNPRSDVYVRDLASGQLRRISLTLLAGEANGSSGAPSISADGRRVAFDSMADNLVVGDANRSSDVLVYDLLSGEIWWASVSNERIPGAGGSYMAALSADGSVVAFESDAPNLVPGDTNATRDIFCVTLPSGRLERISVGSDGHEGDGFSTSTTISGDGRLVAFLSISANLVPEDADRIADIYVRDRATGRTMLVSVSSAGAKGDGRSDRPKLSGDGRYIVFESSATNLVHDDTNNASDIFLHDLATRQTTRVSVSAGGLQADGDSYAPDISPDGRYLVFESMASNLVADDDNDMTDIFWRDLTTGRTLRIPTNVDGSRRGWSSLPTVSADGRRVAFAFTPEPTSPSDSTVKEILLYTVPEE